MTAPARQPLNLDAADLRGVADFKPWPLRELIDVYRARMHAQQNRLDEALRYDATGYIPPGRGVGRPDMEAINLRRIKSTLHYLLQLHELETTKP